MKNTLSVAVLLIFLCVLAQAQTKKIESVYTNLTGKNCRDIEIDESGAGWYRGECKGIGGYKLEITEGDIRQSINIIAPGSKRFELDFQQNVSFGFSSIGEKAEWRVVRSGKKLTPMALIVRLNANENSEKPEKVTSYLVVVKINKDSACITDVVAPIANQNVKARELADKSAGMPCKSTEN